MGVDGGAGNAISLSEIQTYYGGSNPVSLSEYYRGGSEVPGNQVTAQAETSGTSDQTIGEFTADVTSTSAFTGSIVVGAGSATLFRRITFSSSGSTITGTTSYTVTADDATIGIFAPLETQQAEDDTAPSGTVVININGGSSINCSASGSNETPTNVHFQGPAALGASLTGVAGFSSSVSPHSTLSTGDVINIVSFSGQGGGTGSVKTQRRASVTTHDVDFTNNSSVTITTTSGSTGGAQSYTAGQTRKVKNDSSTNSYVLGYDAVNGNTNVPASGTINIDVFNAPGSATP